MEFKMKTKTNKECILHVGFSKTGTTSIQEFLFINKMKLLGHGVCYPTAGTSMLGRTYKRNVGLRGSFSPKDICDGVMKNRGLGNTVLRQIYSSSFKLGLKREIGKLTEEVKKVIISDEDLTFYINKRTLKDIKLFLETHFPKITILVTLRDPVSFLVSSYSQYIKTGGTAVFEPWCDATLSEGLFLPKLDIFSEIYGQRNIKIISYRPDMIGRFGELLGFDASLFAEVKSKNASLSSLGMTLLRNCNILAKKDKSIEIGKIRKTISNSFIADRSVFPELFSESIVSRFDNEYQKISKTFENCFDSQLDFLNWNKNDLEKGFSPLIYPQKDIDDLVDMLLKASKN